MGDSTSFSSLFALVDNHLSKSKQEECQSGASGLSSFKLPLLTAQKELSDSRLTAPCIQFPLPSLNLNRINSVHGEDDAKENTDKSICITDRPIHDVLTIQLNNMFKAREEQEKRKQELKKAVKNLKDLKLEDSGCLIDLMPAVQESSQVQPQDMEILSRSSSMESVDIPDALAAVEVKPDLSAGALDIERPVSPKPIMQDISYILSHKIGKCSQFGKVLCARYRPVAAPYLKTRVPPNNIKVFDFSTPSPDDLILERLKKPSQYTNSSNSLMVFE